MELLSIKDWIKYKTDSDEEANYYRLLAIVKNVTDISDADKNKALGILKDMILDLEDEHQTYFDDYKKLRHILMGKHVICLTYLMLKHKDQKISLDLLVEKQIWKKIKIESTTAV